MVPIVAMGQIAQQSRLESGVTAQWNSNDRWQFYTSLHQRTDLNDVTGMHVQFTQYATYDIGFYATIGAGFMYRELSRFKDREFRWTAQYTYSRTYNAIKLAHRVRWDQRYREDDPEYRLRYRLSFSMPLNGFKVDVKEYYVTAGSESLYVVQSGELPEYDQRLYAGVGFRWSDKLRIQSTTEHRWESLLNDSQTLLFVNLGLFYRL